MKTREKLAQNDTAHDSTVQESGGRVDDLGMTTNQLDSLYKICKIIEKYDQDIEGLFREVVDILPGAMLHPECACAKITINDTEFTSGNFRESRWSLSEDLVIDGAMVGVVEIFVTGEMDADPQFSSVEAKLLEMITRRVSGTVERDNVQKSMQARLDFFQKLINTVPNPIFYKDAQGSYQGFNLAFELFTALSREELLGKTIHDIAPAEQADKHHAIDRELLRNGGTHTMETDITRSDGGKVISVISRSVYLDSDGNPAGIVGVVVDVTEQRLWERNMSEINKRLEEMNQKLKENQKYLVQSEKMASIGQLAAGVAHEINNPVGFVKSNLGTLMGYINTFKSLLSEYDALTEAVREDNTEKQMAALDVVDKIREEEDLVYILEDVDSLISESVDGTERVREIVQNLKSFARVDEAKIKEADINEGIEATLKMVWNELKYKCTVIKDLKPLPRIRCNPGQLNQVFMNLFVNAAHAIAEKGEIRIATDVTDSEVIVTISDTGCGIPDEIKDSLFEPFFTTKPGGKGTGLGLSISMDIIHKHNGVIEMESDMGVGTTFTIRLPIGGVDDEG